MFRRIVALLLAMTFLTSAVLLVTAGSQDKPVIGGVYLLDARDADSAEINGTALEFAKPSDTDITVTIVCSGIDYQNNVVMLGGKNIGVLSNGENVFALNASELGTDSELLVVLYPGSPSSVPEAAEKVYGTYNIDDMVVTSVTVKVGHSDAVSPSGVNKYMPIVGSAGTTTVQSAYSASIAVGDGWNASTNQGGSTPDVPIKLGYTFKDTNFKTNAFLIDTTKLADGEYDVVMKKGGKTAYTVPVVVDNTAPSITIACAEGVISYTAIDRSKCTAKAWIDGEAVYRTSYEFESLTVGEHCLYVVATDSCGNCASKTYLFTVTHEEPAQDTYYCRGDSATKINAYGNRLGEIGMSGLRSDSEVLIPLTGTVTESVGNSVPYQSFVIETGDSEQAIVTYTGEVSGASMIELSVYDRTEQKWVAIGYAASGVESSFIVDTKNRTENGLLRVRAMPYLVGNGSDTVAWISDTQYMASFEDLNYLYEGAMNYCKEQYQNNNLSYVLHTGDLVDNTIYGDDLAHKEFAFASHMQQILDDAGVPNGVVSGNHDVCHKDADYKYYSKYFGAERYLGTPWYGGQIKNNTSHYDLVTVGGYDFIFLFLGCYDEAGDDVIAWADAVLKKYSDRNAVICTHEYLLWSGHFSGSRAPVIWDKLVVPNENVKMVLCGHNEGVCNQWRKVEGTDRMVYEMLVDYQFAELGNDVQHVVNNCTCDGEGFIRLLSFDSDGMMNVVTYSPALNDYDYYASYLDSFSVKLELIQPKRSIKTTDIRVGVNITETQTSDGNADVNIVVNEDGSVRSARYTSKEKFEYPTEPDDRDYSPIEVISRGEGYQGYKGVAPTLRFGISGDYSQLEYLTKLDLVPKTLSRSSGSADYLLTKSDHGINITYSADSLSWTTLRGNVSTAGTDLSKYSRLYFSVTPSSMSAKWNMLIYIDGKEIGLSQVLYENFGFDTSNVPSDITGAWSGYIDLSDYLKSTSRITAVAFVAASEKYDYSFDYLFLASADESDELTCVVDSDRIFTVTGKKGDKFTTDTIPYRPGYVFKGWFADAECTTVASLSSVGTVYAGYDEAEVRLVNAYYSDEVTLVGETKISSAVGSELYATVAVLFVLAVIAVAVLLGKKIKNKNKNLYQEENSQ